MFQAHRLQEELATLRERIDAPVVLVTHDLMEARALADRICVIHKGETLQTGSPFQYQSSVRGCWSLPSALTSVIFIRPSSTPSMRELVCHLMWRSRISDSSMPSMSKLSEMDQTLCTTKPWSKL